MDKLEISEQEAYIKLGDIKESCENVEEYIEKAKEMQNFCFCKTVERRCVATPRN